MNRDKELRLCTKCYKKIGEPILCRKCYAILDKAIKKESAMIK